MQPKFFENNTGKFFMAALAAMVILAALYNDAVFNWATQLVGNDAVSYIVAVLVVYVGFVFVMLNTDGRQVQLPDENALSRVQA